LTYLVNDEAGASDGQQYDHGIMTMIKEVSE